MTKTTGGKSTLQYKKMCFINKGLLKSRSPNYGTLNIEENAQIYPWASAQDFAHLNNDCVTCWKKSRCLRHDVISIQYFLSQDQIVAEFFSRSNGLQMFPELNHLAIKISGKSRPCSWSTSSYPLFRKYVVQKLRNPSLQIYMSYKRSGRRHRWKSWSTSPVRRGGRI